MLTFIFFWHSGRYYYWNTETDDVCWMSPANPKALVGRAAPEMREELVARELAEANKPKQSLDKKPLKKKTTMDRRRQAKEREELDPMDPSVIDFL